MLAKHDAVLAGAQLKTLRIGHVRALLQRDEEAPKESGAGGEGGRVLRAKAQTQPESMMLPAATGAA